MSRLPAVAAATSWMEQLKMPMRQIFKQYTRSELALMAWRSAEMAVSMHRTSRIPTNDRATGLQEGYNGAYTSDMGGDPEVEHKLSVMGQKLEPIIHKMTNEKGEIDLRRLTGPEALRYMAALGIPIAGRVLA